jgi:hypothetical protein
MITKHGDIAVHGIKLFHQPIPFYIATIYLGREPTVGNVHGEFTKAWIEKVFQARSISKYSTAPLRRIHDPLALF